MTESLDSALEGARIWQTLREAYVWRQIPNCPGRLVLRSSCAPGALPDDDTHLEIRVEHLPDFDPIHIVEFGDGFGLISYEKQDGWIHTLNDRDGFLRKLEDLGLFAEHAPT